MMIPIEHAIDGLDPSLFSLIDSQTTNWDRRALLALHSGVATTCSSFNYLEIGSYLGGSLQVVMRDARCNHVISIDPRPAAPPDKRSGTWNYADNSTARMLGLLRQLPDVNMSKLTTLESGTDGLLTEDLPSRPDWCFIDGEHTDEAALRDARFCAEAVDGEGVIAFHDYELVKPAIHAFLHEVWRDLSFAAAFSRNVLGPGGGVFALELGSRGIMTQPIVDSAIASRWHCVAWRMASRPRRSAIPFLLAWSAIPRIDAAVSTVRNRLALSGRA